MERKVCTYCGKEGHHAANCPWRPSRLVLALVAALAVTGCGEKGQRDQDNQFVCALDGRAYFVLEGISATSFLRRAPQGDPLCQALKGPVS